MDYAYRLANHTLSSFEYWRVYFDLTMCYKIVNKFLDIDAAEMFTASSNVHSTQENAPVDHHTSSWFSAICVLL